MLSPNLNNPLFQRVYQDYDINGVVYSDGKECVYYEHKNDTLRKIASHTIYLQNQFRKGGQSTNRLARIRDIQREQYIKNLAERAIEYYYDKKENKSKIVNILFCGPAEFKTEISQQKELNTYFKNIHVITMDNLNTKMINDVINGLIDPKEKKYIDEIKEMIMLADDRLLFGDEIIQGIKECIVKKVYIHIDSKLLENIIPTYDMQIIKIKTNDIKDYGAIGVKFY